jgi:hypothetical protein
MLGMKTYPQEYIDQARTRVASQVAAYETLAAAAKKPAIEAFEPILFNNMVLVLEQCFVHRLRGVEGKDGNPLNEVRVLASSLLEHDGKLTADPTIKLDPATSVLKGAYGDEIQVRAADFVRLADAFFAELERKFLA